MAQKPTLKLSAITALVRSIAARFPPSLSSPCRLNRRGEKLSRMEIGALGERLAARFLQKRGWTVLYRNYRAPQGGEADLVMRGGAKKNLLVFLEVKTRTRRGFGRPLDAVNPEKQELLERAANSWLRELGHRDLPWRFDVVEIILEDGKPPDITLVEDAF